MSADLPILDLDDALHRALGDVAFLKMMFDEFEQMLPEMVATMTREMAAGDLTSLGKSAHQLKGAAANAVQIGDLVAGHPECRGAG